MTEYQNEKKIIEDMILKLDKEVTRLRDTKIDVTHIIDAMSFLRMATSNLDFQEKVN